MHDHALRRGEAGAADWKCNTAKLPKSTRPLPIRPPLGFHQTSAHQASIRPPPYASTMPRPPRRLSATICSRSRLQASSCLSSAAHLFGRHSQVVTFPYLHLPGSTHLWLPEVAWQECCARGSVGWHSKARGSCKALPRLVHMQGGRP